MTAKNYESKKFDLIEKDIFILRKEFELFVKEEESNLKKIQSTFQALIKANVDMHLMVQTLATILVEKGITTEEEVNQKFSANQSIALQEIEKFEKQETQ